MVNALQLVEVKNKKDIREFHDLAARIYHGDSNWIRPLVKDIEQVFNPSSNKLFRNGDAIRWLLKDASGKSVGRVAAFYSKKIGHTDKGLVGGMGFFECINDRNAARTLFDACRNCAEPELLLLLSLDGHLVEPFNYGYLHVQSRLHLPHIFAEACDDAHLLGTDGEE